MEAKKTVNKIQDPSERFVFESKNDGQFTLLNRLAFTRWLAKQDVKRKIKLCQQHHTWIPNYESFKGDNHFKLLHGMRNYHMNRRGFSDGAQNITTFPDGTIGIGRLLSVAPAGIKGANSYGICIEHIGDFDKGKDTMTDEQRKTILFINAVLLDHFGLEANTDTVVYHHWYVSKSCPGSSFFGGNTKEDAEANFIPEIQKMLNQLK